MKKTLIVSLICISASFVVIAQQEPLYRTASNVEPYQQGNDGTILLKVPSSGVDKAELDVNAKKVAIYNAIFVGYPEANGIPKSEAMAKSSLYDQKKAEFDVFINDPATPAKYNMTVTNHPSIPISKVSRKLLEGPVIVSLNIRTLRRDLEDRGWVSSVAQLGYKPSVAIIPDESWLTKKNYFEAVENQGVATKIWKYREAIIDEEFKVISDNFKSKYEKFFEIKSIADVIDARNNQELLNNLSQDGIVQSPEAKLMTALSADLIIRIDITSSKVNGKNRSTVTLRCTDPFTNTDVINGSPVMKDSHEDAALTTKAAFLGASDDIYPRITDYFITRNSNGAQGVLSVEISGKLQGELDFESSLTVNNNETTLERVIKGVLNKGVVRDNQNSVRHEADGVSDKTRLSFKKVFIPIYIVDAESDVKEKNSFKNLGKSVQAKLKQCGLVSTVVSTGLGSVVIRITDRI